MGTQALNPISPSQAISPVVSSNSEPMDEIVGRIAHKAMQTTETVDPSTTRSLDPKKITTGANPACEATHLVLEFQQRSIALLRKTEETTRRVLAITDQLIDLSHQISALSKDDKIEFDAKTKAILADLREKGIDLLDEKKTTLSKDEWIELKSTIGARIDQSRTQVQQIFTKIQTMIQDMMSVNDSGKKIISDFTQFMRSILKNMRPG